MNISDKKEQLHKLSNDLVDSYNSIIEITNNQGLEDKKIIKKLTDQIIIQKREIDDKDKMISSQNKKCYDYEVVINEYQDRMVKIEEETKTNNKVSIVISQANELENKDRYIEQLENKIKLIKSKNIGISESPISRNNDVFKKDTELKITDTITDTISDTITDTISDTISDKDSDTLDDTISDKDSDTLDDTIDAKDTLDAKDTIDDTLDDKDTIDDTIDDKDTHEDKDKPSESSEDDEISYKRITYKKIKYYIIIGKDPQIVYKIDETGDPGNRVGIRTKKNSKFVIIFD